MAAYGKKKGIASLSGKPRRGSIHHITVEPMQTSGGGQGFVTRTHFNRHPKDQAKMDAGGGYMPDPEPDECMHQNKGELGDYLDDTLPGAGSISGAPAPGVDDEEEE